MGRDTLPVSRPHSIPRFSIHVFHPQKTNHMIPFHFMVRIASRARLWLPLALCQLLAISCASKPPQVPVTKASMRYSAASRLNRTSLPTMLYFFPPLLCDAKGKPKESLTPVEDPERGIVDWVSPSATSRQLRRQMEDYFRSRGNQVVSFQDVLAADTPHSILIVSSFYSAPQAIDSPKPGQPDKYLLSMVKASTFDVDLDPGKSRNIASIDGLSFYDSSRKPSGIESRSFEAAICSLGENISGVASLEP